MYLPLRISKLREVELFRFWTLRELEMAAKALGHVSYKKDDVIIEQGEYGDKCYIIIVGKAFAWINSLDNCVKEYVSGGLFGERALLYREPRAASVSCRTDMELFTMHDDDYQNVVRESERRTKIIKSIKLLEMMSDEQIGKIKAFLTRREFEVGDTIVRQGELGSELFIVEGGECVASVRTGNDEQEVRRYRSGDLFGEKVLLDSATRAATIKALTPVEVLVLSRYDFERAVGSLKELRAEQYLADPRKLLADFYSPGDSRGPKGSLLANGLSQDLSNKTSWFVIYRPCSKDSIAKMLGRVGVGKGLNVKGKSAKQGRLSGFVPFLQISDNAHKADLDPSPNDAVVKVFYQGTGARDLAKTHLTKFLENSQLKIRDHAVKDVDDYLPAVAGLLMPEVLLREVYIERQDLTPPVGWETGRNSEPAFMDANLHALRHAKDSTPEVCVYQFDMADPTNPCGLVIAYAEDYVKPVVSDFDTFLVGSQGYVDYQTLPASQQEIVMWSLRHTRNILSMPSSKNWTSRWLTVLKNDAEDGFHPEVPRYGFGDPKSYSLIADCIKATAPTGAVRHGAECFNFYFPQELDSVFLVVWGGIGEVPWAYLSEAEVRQFLLKRIGEGYVCPLNPVWPVRDKGWYEVFEALQCSVEAQDALNAWYPPESGILEEIERIHKDHPKGFDQLHHRSKSLARVFEDLPEEDAVNDSSLTSQQDQDLEDRTDLAHVTLSKVIQGKWRRSADLAVKLSRKGLFAP
eukprot:TRINITY_DN43871_c0_g1_i1.p1 TRINITY_DN43871_c0_g1~~TRINITY_DN43871_c0_g1_i1.p1  ORF type:complete len:833 (+),score=140.44 TRINITY_DN43871_c0_g1_i1:260-2500(+)